MEGGEISGNTATNGEGGGVYLGGSTFKKTGGIIYGSDEDGNSNTAGGGGPAIGGDMTMNATW
jgi:hypothetical protein